MNLRIIKDTIINDNIIVKDSIHKFNHYIVLTSNNDNSQLLTNGLTIILALIAAIIALYQVKSNIISNARITWIENLRNAITDYTVEVLSYVVIIHNIMNKAKGKSNDEIKNIVKKEYQLCFDSLKKIDILGKKILLYLNSEEKEHKKIETKIKNIRTNLIKDHIQKLGKDKIESDIQEIIETSKCIFKKEWTKSKKLFKI